MSIFFKHAFQKIEILKIRIHVAQNVGKVWIGWKKTFLAPFGATSGNFLRGLKQIQACKKKCIFLGGPMGPIYPVWGNAKRKEVFA